MRQRESEGKLASEKESERAREKESERCSKYLHICIYICVYTYTHTHTHKYAYTHTRAYTHLHTHTHKHTHTRMSAAILAPTAVVDLFTLRTEFTLVIAVVAACTVPNVSSVAFAASARSNDNGSSCGDIEKPLDMLLEEEMEMWKEKQNDSKMKERRRTSNLELK